MTETPHEISSRLSPLRDKIINPATRGLRPRFARKNVQITYIDRECARSQKRRSPDSGYLSEANINSYNAHPSSDQFKTCSDFLSCTLSSLSKVFTSSGNPLATVNTTVLHFKLSSAVCKVSTASFELFVS